MSKTTKNVAAQEVKKGMRIHWRGVTARVVEVRAEKFVALRLVLEDGRVRPCTPGERVAVLVNCGGAR